MKDEETVTGMHLFLVIWKAFQALRLIDEKSIQNLDLGGRSDFVILEALLHKGPLPICTIGKKACLTSGSITTAVDRAEKRGYVQRIHDPEDRRIIKAVLTDEGRQAIESKMPQHAATLEAVSQCLSSTEKAILVKLLKKLGYYAEANFNEIIHQ